VTDKDEAHERTAGRGARVHVSNLSKVYSSRNEQPVRAAVDITLSVDAGEFVALNGVSGSGKSTLLHLIGALDRPDSGRIEVDGLDLLDLRGRDLAAYRRSVGFVFQRYHLLPALSALDNVLVPLLPSRPGPAARAEAQALLADVGLQGRERSLPAQLSGGEQQRVAIARALVGRPTLLLADEPTGNLDSATASAILSLLLDLHSSRRMTVIMATHDPAVAARCDRIVRLRDGALVDDQAVDGSADRHEVIRRVGRLS
jgi:putative ABC transport system ATP-binding protein